MVPEVASAHWLKRDRPAVIEVTNRYAFVI